MELHYVHGLGEVMEIYYVHGLGEFTVGARYGFYPDLQARYDPNCEGLERIKLLNNMTN